MRGRKPRPPARSTIVRLAHARSPRTSTTQSAEREGFAVSRERLIPHSFSGSVRRLPVNYPIHIRMSLVARWPNRMIDRPSGA
jgi:hypothetical protein